MVSFMQSINNNVRAIYYTFMDSHHGYVSEEVSGIEKHLLSRLGFLISTISSPILAGVNFACALLSSVTLLSKNVRKDFKDSFFAKESLGVYLDLVLTLTSIIAIASPIFGEKVKDFLITGEIPCNEKFQTPDDNKSTARLVLEGLDKSAGSLNSSELYEKI